MLLVLPPAAAAECLCAVCHERTVCHSAYTITCSRPDFRMLSGGLVVTRMLCLLLLLLGAISRSCRRDTRGSLVVADNWLQTRTSLTGVWLGWQRVRVVSPFARRAQSTQTQTRRWRWWLVFSVGAIQSERAWRASLCWDRQLQFCWLLRLASCDAVVRRRYYDRDVSDSDDWFSRLHEASDAHHFSSVAHTIFVNINTFLYCRSHTDLLISNFTVVVLEILFITAVPLNSSMTTALTTDSVVSSTRALRHSLARFTAPLLYVTSLRVTSLGASQDAARKLESSLFQLRIGARLGRSNDIGRTEQPARRHAGGLGPVRDVVRGCCGSDSARLAIASLDSRIVGNATAVSGSSAAFVNAARYDVAVLATPALCRAKRS